MDLRPYSKILAAYLTAVVLPVAIGVLEVIATGNVSWRELLTGMAFALAAASAAWLKKWTDTDVERVTVAREVGQ